LQPRVKRSFVLEILSVKFIAATTSRGTLAAILKKTMQRFAIFEKSDKFYWSNNRIIYPIIFGCIGILFLKQKLGFEKNFFDEFVIGIVFLTFFIAIILSIKGFTKPDPLRGMLNGFITFEKEKITFNQQIFTLDDIKKIEITNNDYYGRIKSRSKGNFNSTRSNGVDNKIEITLNNNEKKTFYFELYNSDDLQMVKKELINYYLNDKLHFLNLIDVLNITKYEEIQKFKEEISSK
jgi:hypothetical protein